MNLNPSRVCIVRHSDVTTDVRVMKEVRALRDAGFEVDVVCLREAGQSVSETIGGIRFNRIRLRRRRGSRLQSVLEYGLSFLLMAVRLTALFLQRRHALIQVNTMPDFLVFVAAVPRWLGARVLLDLHEPVPEMWMTKYVHPADAPMVRLLAAVEQAAIRYCDQAVTVNCTIRRRFASRGADPGKIAVVRNVPEENMARPARVSRIPGGLTLLTHGTIEKHYGHELMIAAAVRLRHDIDPLRLIIAGDGNYKPYLEDLAARSGCAQIVRFLPWVPAERIAGVLAQADIGLITHFPSPFIELAQPNKLFEYVALKIPVVTSRFAAIQETFDDSCLMFFTPGDPEDLARCIRELHRDPDRRRWLAENAYRRYRPLRWEIARRDYAELVRQLATRPRLSVAASPAVPEVRP